MSITFSAYLDGAPIAAGEADTFDPLFTPDDESQLIYAVLASLFCDALAAQGDEIPDGSTDRRGWWADQFSDRAGDAFGSKLWLLSRSKITSETISRVARYAEDALAWLVSDKIATKVAAVAVRAGQEAIYLAVRLERAARPTLEMQFENLWPV